MWAENQKSKILQFLLIFGGVLLAANLIVLDTNWLLGLKKDDLIKPALVETKEEEDLTEKVEEADKVEKIENEAYRLICQEEISKALATLSATAKESVKTVYQQAPAVRQPSLIYVPLGGGIATTNQSWAYTGGAEAYFNKADYPGAKKISWEAFLKIKDSNGEANARLYDATHQVVISNSEINGGGDSYFLKSSASLNLLEGNNLYQVQLRTSTGYEAYLEGARIKVEY